MQHKDAGPVQVRVDSNELYVRNDVTDGWVLANPEDLEHLWPDGQSINYKNRGIYIGRRPRREARRSATTSHYMVQWDGGMLDEYRVSNEMMNILCFPPGYPSLSFALRALTEGGYLSVAVTKDLILARKAHLGTIDVVCKGELAGYIQEIDGFMEFKCDNPLKPSSKRAQCKLRKEGIVCH